MYVIRVSVLSSSPMVMPAVALSVSHIFKVSLTYIPHMCAHAMSSLVSFLRFTGIRQAVLEAVI